MTSTSLSNRDFFVAGGTLRHDAASYVVRPADEELYRLVQSGQLCYVLTTRQMGKSSLMVRLGRRLQNEGVATTLIDLTTIGSAAEEVWYLSLLDDLQFQLNLETEAESWWQRQSAFSPVKRFTKFIREVVLVEIAGQVAIFIDEVDSALNLAYSDDFFAAIRAIHNQTVGTEDAGRLSLVLLGVATPNELIKNQRRTPFNIGERIDLEELDLANAVPVFTQGLPADESEQIIGRVYDWTSGHPYLMQRICQVIAHRQQSHWEPEDIDALVHDLFFTERALVEESNLQFVNGRILTSPHKEQLLALYQKVYIAKNRVKNDERDPLQNELKLYGLVKAEPTTGQLTVRNKLYRQVFNREWLNQHRASIWKRYTWAILLLVIIFTVSLTFFIVQQNQRSKSLLAETYISNFTATENPTLRLDNLAQLIALGDYSEKALALFDSLTTAEKIALFTNPSPDLQPQIERVVETTYETQYVEQITAESESSQVLGAMLAALQTFERLDNPALLPEIESWLAGRTAVLENDLPAAQLAYSVALSLKDGNPATRYERALVGLALGDNEAALSDLNILLLYDERWETKIHDTIVSHPQLHTLINQENGRYQILAAYVPSPTSTTVAPDPTLSGNTTSPSATFAATNTPEPTPEPTRPLITMTPEVIPEGIAVFISEPLSIPPTTPTGSIVFTCFINNIDQICSINADGTDHRQLTDSNTTDWTASFMNGLETILFSSSRSGTFALYEMTAEGEQDNQQASLLSTPIQGDFSPAASPDDSLIAFTRAEGGNQNIWVMNRDGSSPRPLTSITGDAINPAWSPDGSQIAYSRQLAGEDDYTLAIMNADGSETRDLLIPLEGIGGRADWSPDGRWLAFYAGQANDRDIYLVNVEGTSYYQITNGGDNLGPSFSPDSNWIVFTSGRDGDNDLYLIRLDGNFLTPLTLNETSDWQPRWGR